MPQSNIKELLEFEKDLKEALYFADTKLFSGTNNIDLLIQTRIEIIYVESLVDNSVLVEIGTVDLPQGLSSTKAKYLVFILPRIKLIENTDIYGTIQKNTIVLDGKNYYLCNVSELKSHLRKRFFDLTKQTKDDKTFLMIPFEEFNNLSKQLYL